MIAEQLQAARAAHWRQNQSPILTLEEAQNWVSQHPLCLYLPRHAQLPTPAPSFVEACLGKPQTAPTLAAIESAHALVVRLVASGTVVPLNLFGVVGEQPDFLAHRDALPAVLSLRADPDWKHAPQKSSGHKVSPLVLELWKVLDKESTVTAEQARAILGRELTEAAVLRALSELWLALRVTPVYAEPGQPTRWELMRVQHRDSLAKAGSTGQVTAISLLVSMYLQSVYSATSEEIELFLSPVTSRSRVREAVRGLAATRQIHSLSMDAQTYYFLENGLPAFVEITEKPTAQSEQPTTEAGDATRPALPARPAPRKRQAIAPAGAPPTVQAVPPATSPGSEPIFRRPKPEFKPAPAQSRPAARSVSSRPQSPRPAAGAGWKSQDRQAAPGRAGFPSRPAGPRNDSPVTIRPRWGSRDAGGTGDRSRPAAAERPPFRSDRPRPQAEGKGRPYASRPPRPTGSPRTGAGPYARPAAARPDARGGARPGGARTYARPSTAGPGIGSRAKSGFANSGSEKPAFGGSGAGSRSKPYAKPRTQAGTWTGARKSAEPKPWALPGRKPDAGPRPPRPGGRRDAPSRSTPERYDRPAPSATRRPGGSGPGATAGADTFRPRAPRNDRGSAGTSKPRWGREAGATSSPPPARSPRPTSTYGSRPPAGPRPAGGGRPPYRPEASARPPRGGEASGSSRPRFDSGSRPTPRTGSASPGSSRPGSAPPRGERPARFSPAGRSPGSAGARTRPPRTGDKPAFDRPRPGGFAKSGVKSGSGSRDVKARPAFTPGSRPGKPFSARPGSAKPWARKGGSPAGSGAKPGKPSSSFRGPRPDRKKPAE